MDSTSKYVYYNEEKLLKKPGSPLIIRTFTADDVNECIKFIARTQIKCHPYYICLDWDYLKLESFFSAYIPTYVKEERSLVAILDGKIVGFIGARDLATPSNIFLYDLFPELERFDNGIDQIESSLKEFQKPEKKDEIAFVSTLVVDSDCQGLGIGGKLLDFIYYSPKLMHFGKILIETASYTSKKMVEKRRFRTLASAKYVDFVDKEGKKPFEEIYVKLEKFGLSKENDEYSMHIFERE